MRPLRFPLLATILAVATAAPQALADVDGGWNSIIIQRQACVHDAQIQAYAASDQFAKDCAAHKTFCNMRSSKTVMNQTIYRCCEEKDVYSAVCAFQALRAVDRPDIVQAEEDDLDTTSQIDPAISLNGDPACVAANNCGGGAGIGSTSPIVQVPQPQNKPPPAADPDTAAETAQQEIAQCQSGAARAEKCCNDPYQCGSVDSSVPTDPLKGTEACQKQKRLGLASSKVNNQLASICSSNRVGCDPLCEQLTRKYEGLAKQCNGSCANANVYSSAMSKLAPLTKQCLASKDLESLLAQQATAAAEHAGASQACQNDTADEDEGDSSMTPNSIAGAPKDKIDKAKDEVDAMQECMRDPNSAACRKAAADPIAQPSSGQAAFQASRKDPKAEDFDVPDVQLPDAYVSSIGAGGGGEPPTVNTVPNNSGGGIPGGAPTAGGAAGAPKKAGPTAPGYSTEVFTGGFQAGGYSAPGGPGPDGSDRVDPRYRGRKPASDGLNSYGAIQKGMNLQAYLPGGVNDPNRSKLGMYASGGASKEITNPFTDNWNKISVKFKEKCLLELTGCDLQP